MFLLKLLHASYEGFYVLDCAGVVERCAEAAYGAVALDADHAAFLCELHELVLQLFVSRSHHPAMVHDGAVLLVCDSTNEHAVAVNLLVEHI